MPHAKAAPLQGCGLSRLFAPSLLVRSSSLAISFKQSGMSVIQRFRPNGLPNGKIRR
jgi:hypothetical protein